MILCISENSIHDIKPFCRPLFCHSSVVKYSILYLSYSNERVPAFQDIQANSGEFVER